MLKVDQISPRVDTPLVLHDMALWDTDASEITRAHLQGFYYRASLRTSREEARSIALRIADAINQADEAGATRNKSLNDFTVRQPPMLSGELRVQLNQLPLASRRCAFFALLMDYDLERAVDLKWGEVNYLRQFLHDSAMDVVESMARHISFPYVFWEETPSGPAQISHLRADLEIAFGCSYEILRSRFNSMVIADPQIYADEIEQMFKGRGNHG